MDLKTTFLKFKTNFSVMYLIFGVNLVMFALTLILTTVFSGSRQFTLVVLGAEYLPAMLNGEVWRLITSAFLHSGFFHLAINMWALWNIGGIIERFYGTRKMVTIYMVSALSASLLSSLINIIVFYTSSGSQAFPVSVGASGAIFGLIGVVFGNKFKSDTFSAKLDDYVNTTQLLIFVFYNVLIGFGFNTLGTSLSINNWAHIGGLIGGVVLGLYLEPINSYFKSKFKQQVEKFLFWLSAALGIISFVALLATTLFKLLI